MLRVTLKWNYEKLGKNTHYVRFIHLLKCVSPYFLVNSKLSEKFEIRRVKYDFKEGTQGNIVQIKRFLSYKQI